MARVFLLLDCGIFGADSIVSPMPEKQEPKLCNL